MAFDLGTPAYEPPEDVRDRATPVRRLVEWVGKKLRGKPSTALPDQAEQPGITTRTGLGGVAYGAVHDAGWRVDLDRRSVYYDLDEMDATDTLIHTALNINADCVTGFEATDTDAFEWVFSKKNDAGARKVLDDLKQRLGLGHECWQIVRNYTKFGEEFREIVMDEKGRVVAFNPLPAFQITFNLDDHGCKAPGFKQRRDGAFYGRVIEFAEWQIVPFIYGAKRKAHYGTGLMLPARRDWKRLTMVEDGMAYARLVRAYDKLKHKVPVNPKDSELKQQEAIQRYKENMTFRRGLDGDGFLFKSDAPFQVQTDVFLPEDGSKRADVDVLHSENTQLTRIEDVLYLQGQVIVCTKVPVKYLGLMRNTGALTDGSLTSEDMQFARTLRQGQAVLRQGLIRLGSIALIAQGYDPDALGLNVNLPKISTEDHLRDAEIRLTNAQAAEILATLIPGGVPPALIAAKFMDLSEDEKQTVTDWIRTHENAVLPETAGSKRRAKNSDQLKARDGGAASPAAAAQGLRHLAELVQGDVGQQYPALSGMAGHLVRNGDGQH